MTDGLLDFLVKEKSFNEERVRSAVQRVINSKGKSTQGGEAWRGRNRVSNVLPVYPIHSRHIISFIHLVPLPQSTCLRPSGLVLPALGWQRQGGQWPGKAKGRGQGRP